MKRFGRSEQGKTGILWSVYEAEKEGDFENGTLLASFLRHADAALFMSGSTDAYLGEVQSENTRLRVELAAKQRECDDIRTSAHAQNKLMDVISAEVEKLKLDLSYSRSREDTREFIED